jgi:hypothetical protein
MVVLVGEVELVDLDSAAPGRYAGHELDGDLVDLLHDREHAHVAPLERVPTRRNATTPSTSGTSTIDASRQSTKNR